MAAYDAYEQTQEMEPFLFFSLAAEWERHGITVNAICPGYFITELIEKAMTSEYMASYFDVVLPMDRCGKQGEQDTTVLCRASPHSSYTTGTILSVDGGFTAIYKE